MPHACPCTWHLERRGIPSWCPSKARNKALPSWLCVDRGFAGQTLGSRPRHDRPRHCPLGTVGNVASKTLLVYSTRYLLQRLKKVLAAVRMQSARQAGLRSSHLPLLAHPEPPYPAKDAPSAAAGTDAGSTSSRRPASFLSHRFLRHHPECPARLVAYPRQGHRRSHD